MPQDAFNNYQYPLGTPGVPNQTIESEAYNTFLNDLVINDLNWPRPIHRGGTAATTADEALVNLGGEKASQVVINYNAHIFTSGSFFSAPNADGAPEATGTYVGIVYVKDVDNIVLEARNLSDANPGTLYVRRKATGTWGAWSQQVGSLADTDTRYVNLTGDIMTGSLTVNAHTYITDDLHVWRASSPSTGMVQFTNGAGKYIYYDGASMFHFAGGGVAASGPITANGAVTASGTVQGAVGAFNYVTATAGVSTFSAINATGDINTFGGMTSKRTTIGPPVAPATALYVVGETTTIYTQDNRSMWPGAAFIGWCFATVNYGMVGQADGTYNHSFYGSTGAFIASGVWEVSDGRLKTITNDLNSATALAAVNALAVKEFKPSSPAAHGMFSGRSDGGGPETLYGWVAQDVEQLVPIAVRDVTVHVDDLQMRAAIKRIVRPERDTPEAKALSAEPMTIKAVNDRYMLTTLWSAVQQLSAQNDELRAKVEALEAAA